MSRPIARIFRCLSVVVVALSAACGAQLPQIPDTETPSPAPQNEGVPPAQAPLVDSPALVTIRMFDLQNGWGVSDAGILSTVDGAVTWHDVSPAGVKAFGYSVTTDFVDGLHAWVLVPNADDMLSGILYRTADGGSTWSEAPVPFGGGALSFLDSRRGWMMASLGAGAGSMAIAVYQTEDSGATWIRTYVNDPNQSGAGASLPLGGLKNGITPASMQTAWIGGVLYEPGRLYLYQTADGGRTWAVSPVSAPQEYAEAELQTPGPLLASPQVAFLPVHFSSQFGVMLGMYISRDGGASWLLTPQLIPQGGAVDFVTPEMGFVWNGHEFYKTQDASQTWSAITPDLDFADSFAGMDFVDPQVGFVLSDQGDRGQQVYVTRDFRRDVEHSRQVARRAKASRACRRAIDMP